MIVIKSALDSFQGRAFVFRPFSGGVNVVAFVLCGVCALGRMPDHHQIGRNHHQVGGDHRWSFDDDPRGDDDDDRGDDGGGGGARASRFDDDHLMMIPVDLMMIPSDLMTIPSDLVTIPSDLMMIPFDLTTIPSDLMMMQCQNVRSVSWSTPMLSKTVRRFVVTFGIGIEHE